MLSNTSKCKPRVLIVDDDKSVLQILGKILEKAGCGVTAAESGQEALRILETQTYDVAVMDMRLQDTNGLDLLSRIRMIAPNMTKIMLTGYPSDEDRTRALAQGADYYLAKPIKSETLIEIIESGSKGTRIKQGSGGSSNPGSISKSTIFGTSSTFWTESRLSNMLATLMDQL